MMSTFQLSKTSLEAIPILKGKSNYNNWAKQMESHLKASDAWEIIEGRWQKPKEPSHFRAPIRPQDLIDEHRAKFNKDKGKEPDVAPVAAVAVESDDNTPSSSTVAPQAQSQDVEMTLDQAKEELAYIKTHIEQWNQWKKVERTAINDINSRISETCREELGSLDNLESIWARLKDLYVESTVGTWVKELNALLKLKGARKVGKNPND